MAANSDGPAESQVANSTATTAATPVSPPTRVDRMAANDSTRSSPVSASGSPRRSILADRLVDRGRSLRNISDVTIDFTRASQSRIPCRPS
jgi:hypothetical protein